MPDCKLVKLRPYRIPHAKSDFAENEIKAMADKVLIEPSHSARSVPAVLVPKRDDTKSSVYITGVLISSIYQSYPLPRIDDTWDALGGSCWFSTLDLKSGFYQVSMAEEDKPKIAVSIPGSGLWQWPVIIWTYQLSQRTLKDFKNAKNEFHKIC